MSRLHPITDDYGRPFLNLRISVTQRCNLKCSYCHREGQQLTKDEMSPAEIVRIAKIAAGLGVRRIKLTGGEPLMREDILEITRLLHEESTVEEISMVTNGTLLTHQLAENLKKYGLIRVNVNVPSVETQTYRTLTGGRLEDALEGIRAALSARLCPVKVNMLILRDVNSGQVDSMLDFCRKLGITLQVIELEPLNIDAQYYHRYHLALDQIENALSSRARKVEVRRSMNGRKIYHLENSKVEIVKPVENTEFCLRCTRVRLTSDGGLKPCLMRPNVVHLLEKIRTGANDLELRELIEASVRKRRPFYDAKVSTPRVAS